MEDFPVCDCSLRRRAAGRRLPWTGGREDDGGAPPFLSGGLISKTINLPEESTVEEPFERVD